MIRHEHEDGSVGIEYERGDFVEFTQPQYVLLKRIKVADVGDWGIVTKGDRFYPDVSLQGWSRPKGASFSVVTNVRASEALIPYEGEIIPFPEPPPPPPKDYTADIELYCLYIDNDHPSLKAHMRLFGEILNRKHGDYDRMVREFLRRKHLFTGRDMQQQYMWKFYMPFEAWCDVFDHYATKYREGVR